MRFAAPTRTLSDLHVHMIGEMLTPEQIIEAELGVAVEMAAASPGDERGLLDAFVARHPGQFIAADLKELLDGESVKRMARRRCWQMVRHDQLVHAYLHGMCGVLAEVLHRQTGWEIYALGYEPWFWPCHVGVFDPRRERYVDARGARQTGDEFAWGGSYSENRGRRYRIELWTEKKRPFSRAAEMYEWCREDHLPRLLPELWARLPKEGS